MRKGVAYTFGYDRALSFPSGIGLYCCIYFALFKAFAICTCAVSLSIPFGLFLPLQTPKSKEILTRNKIKDKNKMQL